MTKREFLGAASLGWAASVQALAQAPAKKVAKRMAKTRKLFQAPDGFPNGLSATPEGLWVGEQKLIGEQAKSYGLPEPKVITENAWLLDWKTGKVLKTVVTPCRNMSGMAVGGGYVWMVANAPPQGVFQVDMNSKVISHRQIPLGPPGLDGGGSHGALWDNGKLWLSSLRLRGNIRVDPKTWQPDYMIPFYQQFPDRVRYHGIAIDNEKTMWQVLGNDSKRFHEGKPALSRQDIATGRTLEVIDFVPGSSDPHGLAYYNGKFYGCDAGIHPGWPNRDSPTAGWIFEIEFV
ncbi:MAG: hypothetical protein IT162_00530 [Bryobacterales bacterium]|nr:hypothetical protein [Bryobacterales bacterium]